MLKYFVNHVVFQGQNLMQFMIQIKVSWWENDISSRKRKKTAKKGVAQKSENGC